VELVGALDLEINRDSLSPAEVIIESVLAGFDPSISEIDTSLGVPYF
jgi:hypothetical protein